MDILYNKKWLILCIWLIVPCFAADEPKENKTPEITAQTQEPTQPKQNPPAEQEVTQEQDPALNLLAQQTKLLKLIKDKNAEIVHINESVKGAALTLYNPELKLEEILDQTGSFFKEQGQAIKWLNDIISDAENSSSLAEIMQKIYRAAKDARDEDLERFQLVGNVKNKFDQHTLTIEANLHISLTRVVQTVGTIAEICLDIQKNPLVAAHKNLLLSFKALLSAEKDLKELFDKKHLDKTDQATTIIVKIAKMLKEEITDAELTKINTYADAVKQLIPVEPTPPGPEPGPTPPKPAMIPPGKAQESINKINSLLTLSLRTLDAIKRYYKEIEKEERAAIKKKAENIFQDYAASIAKFAQQVQRVKTELGNNADPNKIGAFNNFLDLFNKLTNGIRGL